MSEYRAFNTMSSYWMEGVGREDDVVISSRVRLARNSSAYSFPGRLTLQQERDFLEDIAAIPTRAAENGFEDFDFIDLSLVPKEEKLVLVEKHLISPALALSEGVEGLIINAAETLSVMINEEDHMRIQSIYPGLALDQCLEKAMAADDMLSSYVPMAFSPEFGYLTACPSNTGTGMRASVMLHLPGLVYTNRANKLLGGLEKYGFTCRGLYGEGSEAKGDLFQISNQITLGLTEKEIIRQLGEIVADIVAGEREARNKLLENEGIWLKDKVYRAEGILKNARLVDIGEAFTLLSALRLGTVLGMVNECKRKDFNRLLLLVQPVVLNKMNQRQLNKSEMMKCRADIIRQTLKGGK